MYIEMTTFAIPTFLIAAAKAVVMVVAIYAAIGLVVGLFYRGN